MDKHKLSYLLTYLRDGRD